MSAHYVTKVALSDFYHTQRNNKYNPFVTCFPTSVAMCIDYILTITGKKPSDLGIDEEQIEDFLTKQMKTSAITSWMVKTLGSWTNDYFQKAWLVGKVEEKEFDTLMNKIGYDSEFSDHISFDEVCALIDETDIPQVICGNFSSANAKYGHKVGGHINCCVGYDDETRDVFVLDPYGYALSKGYEASGFNVRYSWDTFFAKNKDKSGWCLQIRPQ